MFSIQNGLITIGEKVEVAERMEVWYMTPFGLVTDKDKAISILQGRDLDPEINIKCVPVAVSATMYEVL